MKFFSGIFFSVFATSVIAREIPSFIPICQRSSPMLTQCLTMASAVLQPRLAKGIKELNIPPLEPLQIPMIKLEQGTGAVNYKLSLTNIKIYGLSNYKFHHLAADFSNGVEIKGKTDLPTIRLVADYEISGRVLVLPIQGNGVITANTTDCIATVRTKADLMKRKGMEVLQTKGSELHLEIGGATVHFSNLFNGDPVLSKTTNDFFNENAKDILNEVKPAIEAVAGMLVDDILNKVFKSAPYEKLFPK